MARRPTGVPHGATDQPRQFPTGANAHDGRRAATEALISDVPALPGGQRSWCGKLSICPNEMVPLQIDLALGDRRYLLGRSANPGAREPALSRARGRVVARTP